MRGCAAARNEFYDSFSPEQSARFASDAIFRGAAGLTIISSATVRRHRDHFVFPRPALQAVPDYRLRGSFALRS